MALPASEKSNYLPFAAWGFLLIYTIGDKEILINDANFRKAPLQPPTNHPFGQKGDPDHTSTPARKQDQYVTHS